MSGKTSLAGGIILSALLMTASTSQADRFVRLDAIPSEHGVYYTTMAPHGDYLAMGDQRSPGAGVDIINIANPQQMTLAANIPTGHMTYELDWEGNYVYCPAADEGLFIYDVSDFGNINLACDTSFGAVVTSVVVRDNMALVGGNTGLYVFDVTDPRHPVITSCLPMAIYVNAVAGDGILYAFQLYQNIIFVDIANPSQPSLISFFPCPGVVGLDIDEYNHRMYALSFDWGLKIYDITDVTHPTLLGALDIPGAFAFHADHAREASDVLVVSAYIDGIYAVDVSDPAHPQQLARWRTPQQSNYVLVYKSVIYNTAADTLFSLMLDRTIGIEGEPNTPLFPMLSQNYPNPFNESTTISYSLPVGGPALLEVYDALGRRVTTLLDAFQAPGSHNITWDANGCASGEYYYRLTTRGVLARGSATLIK